MRKLRSILFLIALLPLQQVFADDSANLWSDSNASCEAIAKACSAAGYSDKKFWMGCMGPVLLNKTVTGVTVETSKVQDCRAAKIEQMKKELDAYQQASK